MHIVEDDIDITESDNLIDFSIEDNCYVNDKFIGTTVCKKITVNILNPNNEINLENKEISVQTGVVINNIEEVVPFGNYIIPKPDTEEIKEKTNFVGYDYMIKFNAPYKNRVTCPISAGELFEDLCDQVGLEAGSTDFINSNYMILGNPFTNNEDCRTVLSNIAQLAGGFAKIGRDNKPYIKSLKNISNLLKVKDVDIMTVKEFNMAIVKMLSTRKDNSDEQLDGNNYLDDFTKNNKWGEVNSLILRISGTEGENTTIQDKESIQKNGLTELVIEDNYFLINQEEREKAITPLWSNLKGIEYLPFKTTYYGYPYLDSGDLIYIQDVKDIGYISYVFNHTFTFNGGYSGTLETTAMTKTQTAYKNTINNKTKFRHIERKIDKINGVIEDIIEEQTETTEKISKVKQTVDGITQTVSSVETKVEQVEDKADNAQSTADSATQKAETAQDTADTAQTSANNAQSTADGAVSQITTTNQKVSRIEQNVRGITQSVSEVEEKVTKVESTANTAQTTANTANTNAQNAQEAVEEIKNQTIYNVDVMYALSTSSTQAPTSGWQTIAPQWENGKYMWQKTVTTYGDGSKKESNATCITGAKGQDGKDGQDGANGTNGTDGEKGDTGIGVKSLVEQYYLSNSNTTQTGGSWKETQDKWTSGKYIWTRNKITWTDNSITYTTPILATGLNNANSVANTANNTANTANSTANTANNTANEAKNTADATNNNLTTNYYTKTETNSQINQKADSITSSVSKTYSTKTETANAKNEAINSANASTDEKLENYSTTTEMNSAISQKADEINLEVNKKVGEDELGTKITQNYESVQIAWNKISEFIQFINAQLQIKNESKKILMALDKLGMHFYDSIGNQIGDIGLIESESEKQISFAINGDKSGNTMVWGIKKTSNGETTFFPIFRYGDYNTQEGTGYGGLFTLEAPMVMQENPIFLGNNTNENSPQIYGTESGYAGYVTIKTENGFEVRNANGDIVLSINLGFFKLGEIVETYINLNGEYVSHFLGTVNIDNDLICNGNVYLNEVPKSTSIYSIGGSPNSFFSAYFNNGGSVFLYTSSSDRNLKKNIKDSKERAVEKIKKIKHRQFDWKSTEQHQDIGYIAQEMEKIDKNFVHHNIVKSEDGTEVEDWQINILNVLTTTTKAIQEQQEEIEELKEKNRLKDIIIENLTTRIENLEKRGSNE